MCVSEGDINLVCLSIAPRGSPPDFRSTEAAVSDRAINLEQGSPPLPVPDTSHAGAYKLCIQMKDKAGHESPVVCADFSIIEV